VLGLVSEGLDTEEIARALFVTEDTVKTHVARIRHKLGARTRAHAVAIAIHARLFAEEAL
jgi:DNA-binding CsgD family transcriptional regulator